MKLEDIRASVGALWGTVAEGWEQLRQSATGALTRYLPGDKANLPSREDIKDAAYVPGANWAMLGGDVFEDDTRVIVRIEAPGMDKQDFDIQVLDDALVVRGEKRFVRESTRGQWRVLQCAYGSFLRTVALPAAVRSDQASASYSKGVLRVELPKAAPGQRSVTQIRVD